MSLFTHEGGFEGFLTLLKPSWIAFAIINEKIVILKCKICFNEKLIFRLGKSQIKRQKNI